MEQDKSERLVVIPYVNIQEIIGESNKIIEYEFNNPIFKNIVNNSSTKYILLTSNLKSTKYSFLIAIKAELITMESVENNSDENSMVLKLRIIEVVRIHIDTIRYLDEKIAMANYLTMCSPDFASIKDDVEKIILDIRYIEDEHMPKLPTFDSESNIESLEQYSYRLNCFIVTVVSKVVKVDNLEDFFNGHVLIILKKAKCILLQYLEIKAKEEQVEQDTIFQEKISFGQILPLIPLDSTDQVKLIPLMQSCDNVYISNFVKNQLIKCTKILQGKRCYVALIPEFDVKSQEDIGKNI